VAPISNFLYNFALPESVLKFILYYTYLAVVKSTKNKN
jgi:hypothetical protein